MAQDPEKYPGGVSLGIDLSRFAIPAFDKSRIGMEGLLEVKFSKRSSIALEGGIQNVKNLKGENYVYDSKGKYMRIGINRTMFSISADDQDIMFSGLRYGYSETNQDAAFEVIDPLFGNVASATSDLVKTHWLETVIGIRVELISNLYIALSGRARLAISKTEEKKVPQFINAGYGNSLNKLNVGISYTLIYNFPFYKVK